MGFETAQQSSFEIAGFAFPAYRQNDAPRKKVHANGKLAELTSLRFLLEQQRACWLSFPRRLIHRGWIKVSV
jgi:hypothetical protein